MEYPRLASRALDVFGSNDDFPFADGKHFSFSRIAQVWIVWVPRVDDVAVADFYVGRTHKCPGRALRRTQWSRRYGAWPRGKRWSLRRGGPGARLPGAPKGGGPPPRPR